jgi:hypothetical protein
VVVESFCLGFGRFRAISIFFKNSNTPFCQIDTLSTATATKFTATHRYYRQNDRLFTAHPTPSESATQPLPPTRSDSQTAKISIFLKFHPLPQNPPPLPQYPLPHIKISTKMTAVSRRIQRRAKLSPSHCHPPVVTPRLQKFQFFSKIPIATKPTATAATATATH